MPISLFATSLERYQDRLAERLAEVAASGRYILGPEVEAFEAEFASYLGVKHCVGVANGTDALEIGLRALGVERGDEVVVPSFTFYATAEAVASIGARPVFCDVDPETMCVTAETVRAVLTPKTNAIVPVHLFGNVAPVPELLELGLPVLEDSAQAAGASLNGAKAGGLGDAATFSFFPSKNLPCLGDGGAVTTNHDEVAQLARRLRFHGSDDKSTFVEVGYNSRLDELQAAVLRVLLPELDGWHAARREAADAYARHGIAEHAAPQRPVDGAEHAYHLYVVRSERADALRDALEARGVQARGYYRVPLHRQPALREFAAGAELPATE
jgi:dTDP-4-amino-4,6-dideoxygalactose transaminase